MCEHCMRPGYFGPPQKPAAPVPAEPVLACNDCGNPLEGTPTGGFRCTTCGYSPSMQDTFIFYRCPKCRTKLEASSQALVCRNCGLTCVGR
jgi:DNA-directed RNA polymerase subunit RPC12/RpoP